MRLIDADALYCEMQERTCQADIFECIDSALTIEATQIVRCKDCTNRHTSKCCLEYPSDNFSCIYGVKTEVTP